LLKPHRETFKVSGVRLSNMPEKILRELEGYQLAIEVLKSRGFSGSFCCLGVVVPSCRLRESSILGVASGSWRLV
jgi:hypothetical protein